MQKNNSEKNQEELFDLTPIDLINDSFIDALLDNTFVIFKSSNEIIYLVYSTENNSLTSYDIKLNKKLNSICKAHEEHISNLRHFFNKNDNNDLILSISGADNNIKLWKIINLECLLNLKKINKRGELFSACFLNDNNQNYIITSNYSINSGPIKVFDFKGEEKKEINDSSYRTSFIDTYYDKDLSTNFIITGNDDYVKSYDFNKNKNYHKYIDENKCKEISSIIIDTSEKNKNIIKLISSSNDGFVRIWNFHSGNMLTKIKVASRYSYGICLWDDNHLLVGCGDSKIRIIDLNEEKVSKELTGHENDVLTIKTFILPKYGKCIISQGIEIKLWIKKSN